MKVIQKIKAWRFPCEEEPFYFDKNKNMRINIGNEPVKTKKRLMQQVDECECTSGCKPQKITITVEVAK